MGGNWNGQCHGDGIVSTTNQQWPGAITTYPIFGPAHVEETRSETVKSTVISALQNGEFVFTP